MKPAFVKNTYEALGRKRPRFGGNRRPVARIDPGPKAGNPPATGLCLYAIRPPPKFGLSITGLTGRKARERGKWTLVWDPAALNPSTLSSCEKLASTAVTPYISLEYCGRLQSL